VTDLLARLAAYEPPAGASGPRPFFIVDVFTDEALAGNQLAVFTGEAGLHSGDMQRLAREIGFSETVFLAAAGAGGDARVRIFTPAAELRFAGHPVLGTAALLASASGQELVTLETGAGPVRVRLAPVRGGAVSGWMEQPLPSSCVYKRPGELLEALALVGSALPVELYDNGSQHVFVEVASEERLTALAPDMRALAALGEMTVSCFAGAGASWHTRVFCPALGVPEDPATGSAAGPLALHLARHGRIAFGEQIEVAQGEEIGRPSLLRAVARGSHERLQSVEVGGSAVIVAAGAFVSP
jgi:trans-2,3-dihydro-3-hydroxyanthranilate isomerase